MATIDEHGVLLLRQETEPVPEHSYHEQLVDLLITGLKARAAQMDEVLVFGRLAWFPDTEDTRIRLDPDVMVVQGRPPGHRRSFKAWTEDGIVPSLLIEVVSPEDTDADYGRRLARARQHGVPDVVLISPFAPGGVRVEHLQPDPTDPSRFRTVSLSATRGQRVAVPLVGIELAGGETLSVWDEEGPWPDHVEAMASARTLAARVERLAARLRQAGIDPDED